MIFADTHTHLYLEEFDSDREAMMERALDAGVRYCLLPNIDSGSIQGMMNLAASYPGRCFAMAGLHPTSVKENFREELSAAHELVSEGSVIAIGECGIDLYWDKSHLAAQREAFITQLQWSLDLNLPVSIHIREAFPEVFEALNTFRHTVFKGVFHCFSGGREEAELAINRGFMLGIGGVVTFKKSPLQGILKEISPDCVVLESDAPFLAPVPYRGKRNEPSYIPLVAEKLAEIWGMPLASVADVTTANALRVFKMNRK